LISLIPHICGIKFSDEINEDLKLTEKGSRGRGFKGQEKDRDQGIEGSRVQGFEKKTGIKGLRRKGVKGSRV
jgi:hypothetical protein